MNALKLAGLALILAGALGLVYGGFSYTRPTSEIKLGPLQVSVREKQSVNIPMWAGLAAIAVGAGLLLGGRKR
jgi:LPXTG-motif cell wall-anchored protein